MIFLIEAFIKRVRRGIYEKGKRLLLKKEKGYLSEGKRAIIKKARGHVTK